VTTAAVEASRLRTGGLPRWRTKRPLRAPTKAVRVIFTTTVFDEVRTGPGIYAHYLWKAFRDDPDLEFHVAAPDSTESHPRLHLLNFAGRSRGRFFDVGMLARKLAADLEPSTIVHGNTAHSMFHFADYRGPWLAQVNDYEAAEVWSRPVRVAVSRGPRRLASLAWRHRQERKAIARATRIVCNSDFTRQRILDMYPRADPDRVVRIYKAVDTSVFRRPDRLAPDPLPNRPRGARLLFIGADWERKGLADLIEAMGVVAREVPNVHLTVAGPWRRGEMKALEHLIARAGVQANVLLAGRIPHKDLPAVCHHSDLFTLPTRREALGVAILEAMAAGLPVVSCPVGGVPEIIRSPEEGELTPPRDTERLARAIIALLGDGRRRRRLAAAGLRRAMHFGAATMAANVKKLYLQLAEQHELV